MMAPKGFSTPWSLTLFYLLQKAITEIYPLSKFFIPKSNREEGNMIGKKSWFLTIIVTISLAGVFVLTAFQTQAKEEKKVFNLAGKWEYPTKQGGSIVEIIQEGDEIKGYWRTFSNDFPVRECEKDTMWFEGKIQENKVNGKRYICGRGTIEILAMEISKGGDSLSLMIRKRMTGETGYLDLKRIK